MWVSDDVRIICAVYTYSISYWSQHPYIQLLVIITCTKWYWRVGWRVAAGVGRNCVILQKFSELVVAPKNIHTFIILYIYCVTLDQHYPQGQRIFRGPGKYLRGSLHIICECKFLKIPFYIRTEAHYKWLRTKIITTGTFAIMFFIIL